MPDPLLTTRGGEQVLKQVAGDEEVSVKIGLFELAGFALTTAIFYFPGASMCKVSLLLDIY